MFTYFGMLVFCNALLREALLKAAYAGMKLHGELNTVVLISHLLRYALAGTLLYFFGDAWCFFVGISAVTVTSNIFLERRLGKENSTPLSELLGNPSTRPSFWAA